jgi:serine protease Do
MKRIWLLSLSALLIISSTALGDQDQNERPRRITRSNSAYLGVDLAEVTTEVAGRLRLREERGALVTNVASDTAAAKAGLQKDDVIIKWNGETVESVRELERRIRETPTGRNVRLGVLRNGSEVEVAATLGDRGDYLSHIRVAPVARVAPLARIAPATTIVPRARMMARPATAVVRARLLDRSVGMSLQSMSPQLAEYFGLQNRSGALVTFVHPDSAAAKAGIKAGDVILSVGGQAVDGPGRAIELLSGRGEGAVEVKVMRDRQERSLTLQLEKGKSALIWRDDDMEIVAAEALVEPFEIGPINIEPLHLAPVAVPEIHIAPMPSVTIPEIHVAPMTIPQLRMAPMALPSTIVPKIIVPRVVIPPMRIVMPDIIFRTQV